MERHSRLLLRFVQALWRVGAVRTEAFVFGTRLTRVTRLLRDRNRDRALTNVSAAVNDWAGGTRIGESFREFNQNWARRTLRTSGVVVVVSRRLGSGRSGTRRRGDRTTPAQLPPPDLAQPAGRDARLPAARRRHACGLPVHRRLPAPPARSRPRAAWARSWAASAPATRGGGGSGSRCGTPRARHAPAAPPAHGVSRRADRSVRR